jgi:hypothetical protein
MPMRQRAEVIHRLLKERLATVLPRAMRETGFDMWLFVCQEDNLDPVYTTMIPMDAWRPILQMLVLCDRGEGQHGIWLRQWAQAGPCEWHCVRRRRMCGQTTTQGGDGLGQAVASPAQ